MHKLGMYTTYTILMVKGYYLGEIKGKYVILTL